jgi:hypothetical protein
MAVSDATMSAVRNLMAAGGALVAGLGIHGLDVATTATLVNNLTVIANAIAVLIPAAISVGGILWSIKTTYGKKKVPVEAVAVVLPPSVPVPPVGGSLDLTPLRGTAKVVG